MQRDTVVTEYNTDDKRVSVLLFIGLLYIHCLITILNNNISTFFITFSYMDWILLKQLRIEDIFRKAQTSQALDFHIVPKHPRRSMISSILAVQLPGTNNNAV